MLRFMVVDNKPRQNYKKYFVRANFFTKNMHFFYIFHEKRKKRETFARKSLLGPPKILIFGESENTAKIHMSDVVVNRIEP
jgi:hypothetical protein